MTLTWQRRRFPRRPFCAGNAKAVLPSPGPGAQVAEPTGMECLDCCPTVYRHSATRHARAEDRIRCGKATGFGRSPSRHFAVNPAWLITRGGRRLHLRSSAGLALPRRVTSAFARLLPCDGRRPNRGTAPVRPRLEEPWTTDPGRAPAVPARSGVAGATASPRSGQFSHAKRNGEAVATSMIAARHSRSPARRWSPPCGCMTSLPGPAWCGSRVMRIGLEHHSPGADTHAGTATAKYHPCLESTKRGQG